MIFYILFTAVFVQLSSVTISNPLEFDVNRPFYYYIRHNEGTSFVSLFNGHVNNPKM